MHDPHNQNVQKSWKLIMTANKLQNKRSLASLGVALISDHHFQIFTC